MLIFHNEPSFIFFYLQQEDGYEWESQNIADKQ